MKVKFPDGVILDTGRFNVAAESVCSHFTDKPAFEKFEVESFISDRFTWAREFHLYGIIGNKRIKMGVSFPQFSVIYCLSDECPHISNGNHICWLECDSYDWYGYFQQRYHVDFKKSLIYSQPTPGEIALR